MGIMNRIHVERSEGVDVYTKYRGLLQGHPKVKPFKKGKKRTKTRRKARVG